MRIISTKCWVDWETEKGLRRTAQTSFNVSFQKKKKNVLSCNRKSRGTTSPKTQVHSCSSFCWSQCVFFLFTCTVQASHVFLLSPGAGKGPFPPHVGLLKKVSYVLEASHPQPPGDWLDPHDMPVPIPGSDKGNGTNMTRYFHSGFVQGAVAQQ